MKIFYCFLVIVLSRQALCGILRNPPAFSKPVYSDSYLPAAMQVIFHAVEQLKLLQSEEIIHSSTNTASPSTSPITLTDQDQQTTSQDSSTSVTITQEESNAEEEESNSEDSSRNKEEQTSQQPPENRPVDSKIEEETEEAKVDEASTDEVEGSRVEETSKGSKIEGTSSDEAGEKKASETKMDKMEGTSKDATAKPVESTEDRTGVEESPELNEETPEANYATPETNYEKPEEVHAVEETNQEVEEENHEWISSIDAETRVEVTTALANAADSDRVTIIGKHDEKKEPTIDSVVQGVYEILKPTTSKFVDEELFEESKSIVGVSVEKMERAEEESDENRFTRLGEKVTQVPRPSLTSYLRRSKVPPSATLQQLANLYDSLSKDARKQGFGKYTGYSDEVLNTLETSAEGGIGPQMKKILSKVLERNELTREDARMRASQAVRDLDNPSSMLNKDLRAVLPLRYSP
ncbi:uncharacterized protein LOC107993669 [Apis cerana]|uniref:uncharacterized protein LOC107993669 n=1 Tax=Apis cerana TaxID=7461 RepID=UPI002B22DFE2|nr:uncharacterized protein LOC107993669 [Apis cerana]